MTHLTEEERKAQMDSMRAFDGQMPCIGIFWYDMEEKSFFGVCKSELTPKMVEEAGGKEIWPKEYFRAQAKHVETKFKGDYTQVPRGRVAWNIDKFIVLVGHWAEPIKEELTTLIEQEFNLPYFEFVYDEQFTALP